MALSKIDPAGLDIGQIGGRRNLIINGAMQVAQRGTSSTSGGYSTVDRFTVLKNNMDELEVTASQSTTAPSDQGFPKAYKLDVTTAESALASDENYSIEYRMEGQDLQALQYGQTNARTSVLTFYVRSSQTGQYALAVFQEDGGNDLFVANYTIDTADTFEKKTITIDGNTAAAIANDNTEGLKLKWWLMAGSDFTSDNSAVGNWVTYTAAKYAHGHTVSWGLSASDDFYLTGVQLEVGDTATPFEHRSYGEELALCKRYYEQIEVKYFGIGAAFGGGQRYVQTYTEKRANPTCAFTGEISWNDGSNVDSRTSHSVDQDRKTSALVYSSAGSIPQGNACQAYSADGDGKFVADAEL